MANINSISYSEFNEPYKIEKSGNRLLFINELNNFSGKKIYQDIFIYWITDDSIIFDKKKIKRILVNGTLFNRKTLFRKSLFDKTETVEWAFSLPDSINNALILCYYHNNNFSEKFSYLLLNKHNKRKYIKKIGEILLKAFEEYGFPLKENYVFYDYINEDYKEDFEKSNENNNEIEMNDVEKLFSILEMNPTTNANDIRNSYIKLVRKYHPDLAEDQYKNDFEQKIKEINNAYEYLYEKYK